MAAFDDALRFGGLVMAHAAYVASDLAKGDLVCPFAVIESGGVREVVTFESDSQLESISARSDSRQASGFDMLPAEGIRSCPYSR
jgi:hypothetical protein